MRDLVFIVSILAFSSSYSFAADINFLQTKFEPLDQPLEELLNSGYEVVGIGGPAFVIRKGSKFAICQVKSPTQRSPDQTAVACNALN
jgi:hypothetical protein